MTYGKGYIAYDAGFISQKTGESDMQALLMCQVLHIYGHWISNVPRGGAQVA
jgi:hypothetical protein